MLTCIQKGYEVAQVEALSPQKHGQAWNISMKPESVWICGKQMHSGANDLTGLDEFLPLESTGHSWREPI